MKHLAINVLGIYLALFLGSDASIVMLEERSFVAANPGEDVILTCKSTDFPDFCIFKRPDGREICLEADSDYSQDYNDASCVEDPRLKADISGDRCELAISTLDPDIDHGEWNCRLSSFGDVGNTKINVGYPVDAAVEFDGLWGEVHLNVGLQETLTCKVSGSDGNRLAYPPGKMTWYIGEDPIPSSSDYREDDGIWTQSVQYVPKVADDGKDVRCSVDLGGSSRSDTITVYMHLIGTPRGGDEPVELTAGQPGTVSREFTMFPRPKEVYWDLEAPGGQIQLMPGQNIKRFTSGELQEMGRERYRIDLDISRVLPKDAEGKYALVVRGDREEDDEQVMVVPIEVATKAAPPVVPLLPEVTEEETDSEPEASGNLMEVGDNTTEAAVAAAASSGNISLYIIIAIVALVILMCCLFYCTKCCKNKKDEEEKARSDDPEAQKEQLLKNVEGKADGKEGGKTQTIVATTKVVGSADDQKTQESKAKELEAQLSASSPDEKTRDQMIEVKDQVLNQASPFFSPDKKTIISTTEVVENSVSKVQGGKIMETVTTTTTTLVNENVHAPKTPTKPLALDDSTKDLENEDIKKMAESMRQISNDVAELTEDANQLTNEEPQIQLKMINRCGGPEEEEEEESPKQSGQLFFVDASQKSPDAPGQVQ